MKIVAFHNGNIDPEIIKYQRLVFEHFGQEIEQVETNLPHGEAIDEYLKKPFDKIAIFDIDCIPMNAIELKSILHMAGVGFNLQGVAQQANHIPNSEIYLSPACISFSEATYTHLGKPSFKGDEFGDCGYLVTKRAKELGVQVFMTWPINVEVPKWDLGESACFGLGTTYGTIDCQTKEMFPAIYHAFESRMGNGGMFVRKCKEVLNGKTI